MRSSRSERSKARHEKVETWERNLILKLSYTFIIIKAYHVDSKFTKIGIQLTRESKTGSDTGHGD